MIKYKYELHAHTSEVSRCSVISAKELVAFYKSQGYSGICITDHFIGSNTTVPVGIPWDEGIEMFCRGYELAREEGEKLGIDVFFGWEYSFRGTDLITLGLDKKWLLGHPGLLDYSPNEYCDLVHENGGFLIHAHPFREAHYIDMIRLLPRKVDAVEILNACRTEFENERAFEYAQNYNLLMTAGTDNHVGLLPVLSGMRFNYKINSIDLLIEGIKNSEGEIFSEKTTS